MALRDFARRATRAVWHGPFAVGHLTQPVSLGAALLRILEVIWKFGIAVLVSIISALALAIVWEPIDRILYPSMESQLAGEAHFDPEACSKEFPIVVIMRNKSKRPLESAQFDLVIRQPGRSTNLNKQPSFDWDAIVQPGKANALCYQFPDALEFPAKLGITDDPKALEYSVKIWSASPLN